MYNDEYLSSVREQYENYPYPTRSPADEKRNLYVSAAGHIGNISHYCFSGNRDLRDGARCLVAGGGTGDAVMFLGEQLHGTNTEIVYVDLSQASLNIARERAKARGLTNITWHQRSLLELQKMDIGKFDFIDCCGVLHHLEDPVKGLNVLKSVLSDDGAINIMVYGQYGRTAIYQMQELMRLVNHGEVNLQKCVDNTHLIIADLPADNWYKRDEARWKSTINKLGDIEVYDLFLHSQDRAYTVPDIYEWLDTCGLNMVGFTGFTGQKLKYAPDTYIKDERLRNLVNKETIERKQAIAELMSGNIKTHTFYVSIKQNTVANHLDHDMVPYYSFSFAPPEQLFNSLSADTTRSFTLDLGGNFASLKLIQKEYTRHIMRYLDGNRSLGEIIQCIKDSFSSDSNNKFNEENMITDFDELFKKFFSYELMFVRSKAIKPYKNHDQLITDSRKRLIS